MVRSGRRVNVNDDRRAKSEPRTRRRAGSPIGRNPLAMTEHSPEEKLNKRGRYRLSNLQSTWFAEQALWTDGSRRISQQPGFARRPE